MQLRVEYFYAHRRSVATRHQRRDQLFLQGGKFAGETIVDEIKALQKSQPTPERKAFQYQDRGSMAIIGRNHAVVEIGKLRFGGVLAFLMWAVLHILFLIDFRRKLVVFVEWVWLYFTGARGARLITGDDRMPRVITPPPDFRAIARDAKRERVG